MFKVKVIVLFFVFQTVIVFSQNSYKNERIPHEIYGTAIEQKIFDKDSILLYKKVFTLNKEFTQDKYEIGTYFYYHKNGVLKAKGNYYKPKDRIDLFERRKEYKEGEWLFYSNEGSILSSIFFEENMEHGPFKNYHLNGKLATQGLYKKGVLDGTYTTFFMNEQPHSKIEYKEGKVFNIVEFYNVEGEKINHGTLKNGNGTFKLYDLETGKFKKILKCKNGIKEKETTPKNIN
ncbi:hypothetical protein [Tenacibaculum sp. IB213877]|uniref:toxin-antitoxin system YwqK family antitoxin n=1 Tax=Tenacibaculum sp. IB213877 TaxID=3097351 RepID=UPI002A59D0A9|nr:hypothetical protein [Tenacibaculum sp. IB213877]MDY0779793.1 hypothetical protein [Tenacibaculum sp. IB213877]